MFSLTRNLLLTAFLICAYATATSASEQIEYLEKSVGQKLQDPDLIFAVTFDNLTLDADFAQGSAKATGVKNINLALRNTVGFDSRTAYAAEPGEDLKYSAVGNIRQSEGTFSFWAAGIDYAPKDERTDGKKRGHTMYAVLQFGDGRDKENFHIYEYAGTFDVLWTSSAAPHLKSLDAYSYCRTQLEFKKKEWYQVVFTWKDGKLALYINGEPRAKATLPAKASLTKNMKMTEADSFIGVRCLAYDDKHLYTTGMDDVMVYRRAMTPLEVRNRYAELCVSKKRSSCPYTAEFNGVDTGNGKLDQVEAVFDFSGLGSDEKASLQAGTLSMNYVLVGPDKKEISRGSFTPSYPEEARTFSGISKPGHYTLKTALGKRQQEFSFERPDTSWLGNKIGSEDTVPALWKDFRFNGRTVTLWNRVYTFGSGPLPTQIFTHGKPLFAAAPELQMDDRDITWTAGATRHNNTSVTYTGTGKAADLSIHYETTVEFDGLIRLVFTISGQPPIELMSIRWRVVPEASTYLMTPTLQSPGLHSYPWPMSHDNSQLWLNGGKAGGFCWTAENDANWRYEPATPVLFADTKTGKCRIDMISIPSRVPEGTQYTSLFIATPTRPLPSPRRVLGMDKPGVEHFPNTLRYFNTDVTNSPFIGPFNPRPDANFERYAKEYPPKTICLYNTAEAATTQMPIGNYLRKYSEIPNAYCYRITERKWNGTSYVQTNNKFFTIPVCNKCFINDYIMDTNREIVEHPGGDRIAMFYYDLCGNTLCGNRYHHCRFDDRFGREISSFVILNKRDLIKRTVRFAHQRGISVMLHAQRWYCPMLQGLADFWLPGEQNCAELAKNPYALIDGTVDDKLFRSEYNSDVMGIGIMMLLSVAQLNESNRTPEATLSALTMMLLHHIDFERMFLHVKTVDKLWEIILRKYDFYSRETVCHRFYEQKDILSADPRVQISWYECPGGKKLVICGNRTETACQTTVDFGKIFSGDADISEEFYQYSVKIQDGKCVVTVPPRAFLILPLRP